MVRIEGFDRKYLSYSILEHRRKNMFDESLNFSEEDKEVNVYFELQMFDGVDNPIRKFGSLEEAWQKSLEWSFNADYPVETRIYKVLKEKERVK